jgi:hypothetical protein
MDKSLFLEKTSFYLKFRNVALTEEIKKEALQALGFFTENHVYRYIFLEGKDPLDFMKKEPYASFLQGASGYILFAATLGSETDDKIRELYKSNSMDADVFDCAANAYLELQNDVVRTNLAPSLSYLFCPGYQGSDVFDSKEILDTLKADRLEMKLLNSGSITPSKSMAGFFAKGISPQKKCGSCIMLGNCKYRKANEFCYSVGN